MEANSIAKSWNKLLKVSDESTEDSPESGSNDVDVNSLLSDMKIPSEERRDWLQAHEGDSSYQEYTEEKIASIVREENEANDDKEDDDDIVLPTVSHVTACQVIETILTYLEQQLFIPIGTVVTLNGLLVETAKKRVMNQRQKYIHDYFAKLRFRKCSII